MTNQKELQQTTQELMAAQIRVLAEKRGCGSISTEGYWRGAYLEDRMASLGITALGQITLTGLGWIRLDWIQLDWRRKCSDKMSSLIPRFQTRTGQTSAAEQEPWKQRWPYFGCFCFFTCLFLVGNVNHKFCLDHIPVKHF